MLSRDADALADAVDEMDIASRQRLTAEVIRLKEAVWFLTLACVFIAFLLLR